MWVFTPTGFYSAVSDRVDADVVVVRARQRKDLKALRAELERDLPRGEQITFDVISNEGTDYPYRVRLHRSDWARACERWALAIDYTNFKNAVEDRQGKRRADLYHRVWGALLPLGRAPWRRTERTR